MPIPTVTRDFESFTKLELIKLCDDVVSGNPTTTNMAILFFCADTKGLWHGRARAKLARRFKHVRLEAIHAKRIVDIVINRFVAGTFSEQFKDQLRLVLHLDPIRILLAARGCAQSTVPHVKKYSQWILSHDHPGQSTEQVAPVNAC